jgi:hypothetical protein
MPRREFNNPSERMNRILEEIDDLQSSYIFARNLIAEHLPNLFHTLGPEPNLENIAAERTRQDLTRNKVKYARDAVRRLRLRGVVERHEQFKSNALPDWRGNESSLSETAKRKIEREAEEIERRVPVIKPPPEWQPMKDGKYVLCQYGGYCQAESAEECECKQ